MDDIVIIPAGKRTQQTVDVSNPISGYHVANKDDDGTPNYYGFVNVKGEWYILKETVLAGNDTYRYVKGANNFATNWTNRAALTYDYFYNIF